MSERALLFNHQLRLMVPQDLAADIQAAAVKDQVTMAEFVRGAVKERLKRVRREERNDAA